MRKRHPEHANHERWLVSYADLITLLFALFVVMYAMSRADVEKFKQVAASIRAAFDKNGATTPMPAEKPMDSTEGGSGAFKSVPQGDEGVAPRDLKGLEDLRDQLHASLGLELGMSDLSEKVRMEVDSRGLVIALVGQDLFLRGQSEVQPEWRPVLDRIGQVLARTHRRVRIEGHAEPGEGDSWQVSSARASGVARTWLQRFALDPRQVSIAAFAESRPLKGDANDWARVSNRRVEIVIRNPISDPAASSK